MRFFVDPAIVTLPLLPEEVFEEDREHFICFIESLNDWAMLLGKHKFYVSQDCIKQLYNTDAIEYPPDHTTLDRYWKKYGVGEVYALSDIYEACQRLLDIESLTTIESLAEEEVNPHFDPFEVDLKPEQLYKRQHDAMQKALLFSFGCLTYFKNIDHHKATFKELFIATRDCDETIAVDVQVYTLSSDTLAGTTLNYQTQFRAVNDPNELDNLISNREKIKKNLKVMVVGGHSNFHRNLEELQRDRNLDFRFINPEEDAKIDKFKQTIGNMDCVIEVTKYSSHKLKQIADQAREMGVPVASCNSQGLKEFERVLAELSDIIDKL
ncbi:MAG: DUF2325 domain-containing protein [bacterium]|nr:DUF2325 domain-containing protein [bacterium]